MERLATTLRSLIVSTQIERIKSVNCVFSKSYSQYGPHFIQPYVSKEKIQQIIESGEAKEVEFVPLKAALNDQTCSVFHDEMTRKFTNHITKCGQKALARKLVEETFLRIKHIQVKKKRVGGLEAATVVADPVKILHDAVANSRPLMELQPVKRGGVRYKVPSPITEKRSLFLAMKWLIEAGKEKHRKVHLPEKLASELINAAANQGQVVKRKVDLHRQCEANKAYAHYRWS